MVIVKVIGAADGRPTPHDGRYVKAWDPHTDAGTLALDSTENIKQAKRFADAGEATKEWACVSAQQPVRPWDGKPNRPLTALTVTMFKLSGEAA